MNTQSQTGQPFAQQTNRASAETGSRRNRETEEASMTTAADNLLKRLNRAVADCNEAEASVKSAQGALVSKSKAVGLLLLEAKKLHPAVKDFEAFLKRVKGLQLSRAYDCMRIAGGRTTDEEIRQATRERVKKHRAKHKPLPQPIPKPVVPLPPPTKVSVTSAHVTESPEVSIEQRKREHGSLGINGAAKSKQNLDWFAVACREYLPHVTVESHRQEARRLVVELTQQRERENA